MTGLDAGRVAALFAERGLRLEELAPHRVSLEEAYLRLTEGAAEHVATPAGVHR